MTSKFAARSWFPLDVLLKSTGNGGVVVAGVFVQVSGVVLHNKCGYLFFHMSLTGLLLTGGDGPSRADLNPFLSSIGPIVAADSGYDLALSLGIEPELIVGDMDSVRDCSFPEWKVRRFPRDKSLMT